LEGRGTIKKTLRERKGKGKDEDYIEMSPCLMSTDLSN
jgi:hypothetical protein